MKPGVKTRDIVMGTGDEATSRNTVAANVRLFLNHGTELTDILTGGPRMVIDLHRRDCVAGLRYGIEGMRVGGQRELKISPHLAYGSDGVPGRVPPNAVLRALVELIDVREPGVRKPEDFPPGRHLFVFHPGEAHRHQPRWQFGLDEGGRCGIMFTHPVPGMPWRHARRSCSEARMDSDSARSMFDLALALPQLFPGDCLSNEELWADMKEKGNSITRDRATNTLCLTVGVMERGQWLIYVALPETSRALRESDLLQRIRALCEDGPKVGVE